MARRRGETPRSGTVRAPGDPATTETSEIRWFAEGPVPEAVATWFTDAGAQGFVECRRDEYLLGTGAALGVKRRGGRLLERKERTGVGGARSLPAGPCGPIEMWRKQSPADAAVGAGAGRDGWLVVDKVVTRRRFAPTGEEIDSPLGPPTGGACDAEVTEVRIGSDTAWSLALAASGPPPVRESAIRSVWARLVGGSSGPPAAVRALRWSGGYPAWLAERRRSTAARASLAG